MLTMGQITVCDINRLVISRPHSSSQLFNIVHLDSLTCRFPVLSHSNSIHLFSVKKLFCPRPNGKCKNLAATQGFSCI